MAALRKRESSGEVIRAIDRIELIADKSYRNLDLLKLPWNIAAWVILTGAIRTVELSVPSELYGSRHHSNAATNQSMVAALIYKLSRKYAMPEAIDLVPHMNWTPRIADWARQAFEIGRGYLTFCSTFPYWHANRYAAELIDENVVRFASFASETARRITAYQQGIRPPGSMGAKPTTIETTLDIHRLQAQALRTVVQVTQLGVRFPEVLGIQKELFREQEKRTFEMRRRYPGIKVRTYSLDDFGRFYSAINAVASSHELLSYLWSRDHWLPSDTLLIVEHRSYWVDILSKLTELTREQIYEMLKDVTYGRVSSVDFHLLPFVPLNREGSVLALAPFCSLSANWEENVLRCLSRQDSDLYSGQSTTKEDEMRQPLISLTSGTRLITGGHKLPKGFPDIDLIVQDLDAKVLIICELKWCRKPNGRLEREERDREVLKGFSQIEKIRNFISANSKYLLEREYIAWDISEFQIVHYCVVARDHFVETPMGTAPLYSYDAFASELKNSCNTIESLESLQSLKWLPVEGTDFTVRFERSQAGEVALESEVYYPAGGPMPIVM
jgi:hypothetical protein